MDGVGAIFCTCCDLVQAHLGTAGLARVRFSPCASRMKEGGCVGGGRINMLEGRSISLGYSGHMTDAS